MTLYRHYYYFPRTLEMEFYFVDLPRMERDGFWLDEELNHTTGSKAHFWIPPGQLRYIEKTPAPAQVVA